MKTRIALLAAGLSLTACGTELLGDTQYTAAAGTYAVSNAVSTLATDECGILEAYTDPAKKIGIALSDSTMTFNLANDSEAAVETLPTSTLDGNDITQLTEADYTVAYDGDCVVRIKRSVTGFLTANNTADLTLAFSVETEAGTCNGDNTSFAAVPCSSSYNFTATMEQ